MRRYGQMIFGGRLSRRNFALYLLGFVVLIILLFVLTAGIAGAGMNDDDGRFDGILLIALPLYIMYSFCLLMYLLSITIRRLRGIGAPIILSLLLFVPLMPIPFLLTLAILPNVSRKF